MKKYKVVDLDPGMELGESIYNEAQNVELLAEGTQLTSKHIILLDRLGVDYVYIQEEKKETIESQEVIEDDIIKNVVNQNMEIHLITGENDRPIDKQHEEFVTETKNMFKQLSKSDSIDIESVKKNVHEALPDMIRNDNVLRRLEQLKRTDDFLFEHAFRVSILASNIAKWMGYPSDKIEEIAETGLLFDIGKIKLDDSISKNGFNLSQEELEQYQRHPQLGYNVLLKTPGVSSAVKYAVLQHEERLNGSGYPLKIKENQIHEYSKIIMVCDVFNLLITPKPQGKGVSYFEAFEYLDWNSGNLFDTKIVYLLIKKMSHHLIGSKVELDNGKIGKIIYIDVNFPKRPTIEVDNEIIDLIRNKSLKIVNVYD